MKAVRKFWRVALSAVLLSGALAAQSNPPREITEAARQSYVQANVMFRNSQSDADIKAAIGLYNDALAKAPWFSDAWYNLSLAQEKLGDYASAVNSMKSLQPLEAGGPNERRDLDRMYTLQAEEKLSESRHSQHAALEDAAARLQSLVGSYTLYKFFIVSKLDRSNCSPDEAATTRLCMSFPSDTYRMAGHDGSAIGSQATVTTESDHVVLTLGTQRFCMSADAINYAASDPRITWNDRVEHGVTDCNNPQAEVRILTAYNYAIGMDANGNSQNAAINGTHTIVAVICPDAECRHADIATYWLRP